MLFVAQKLEIYNLLIKCALSLGYQQPSVFAVPEDELELYVSDIGQGKIDAVLKRTQSRWSNHVVTPHTKNPKSIIKKALKEQRQWKSSNHSFDEPLWLCQSFMGQLLHIGEYRSFIVNGAIYYTVVTTPSLSGPEGSMEMAGGRMHRPLDAYRCVSLFFMLSFSTTLPTPSLGTTPKTLATPAG